MLLRNVVGLRVATALVALALLAGCGGDGAVRSDDASGGVATPGAVNAFDTRVGDCFQDEFSGLTQVSNVEAVPCDQPHRNEVFALFDLPDGEFPGEDEVVRQSQEGCVDRFADFVGIDYHESRLDVTYLFPTQQSWDLQSDREVVCAVYDPNGSLEGTVSGAGEEYALPGAGDCVDDQGAEVPCKKKHDAEIIRVSVLKGEEYPGDNKLRSRAERMCGKAFERYVGIAYASSALGITYTTPDEESWGAGDRRIVCFVRDPSGPSKGSVEGSAR